MGSPSSRAGSAPRDGPLSREPSTESEEPAPGERSLTRSAGVVSAGVMVSRVLGLVREQVLAYLFAARTDLDAFYGAFRIPNLLRDMFGEGALSKAFVSTFSEIREKEGPEAAARLANLVLNALVLVIGFLTLLGIVYSDRIVALAFPGDGFDTPLPPESAFGFATKRELTVRLTQIMFPFIFLVSLAALAMGILNASGRFLVPALASSFFNLGSVTVGVLGYFVVPRYGLHPTIGMALGVLAGGALQLLWQVPSVARLGYRYRPRFDFGDPWLRKVVTLFVPGAIIASTVQVNLFVNSIFASRGDGWLTWIMQAFRILHLPLGLIAVAISVATLPALSRAVAREDKVGFKDTFSYATRLVIVFTLPATVGLYVLAVPIVRLIFEQGRFGPDDTAQVAAALRFYALGLLSFAAVKIVTDGFYAIQDVRAPLAVSVSSMLTNVVLNWLFVVRLGMDHTGLALATSATTTVSLVALWILFRRRSGTGGIGGRATLATLLKTGAASAVMGAVVFGAHGWLEGAIGSAHFGVRLVAVGVTVATGIIVFFAGCRLFHVRELDQALSSLRRSEAR